MGPLKRLQCLIKIVNGLTASKSPTLGQALEGLLRLLSRYGELFLHFESRQEISFYLGEIVAKLDQTSDQLRVFRNFAKRNSVFQFCLFNRLERLDCRNVLPGAYSQA